MGTINTPSAEYLFNIQEVIIEFNNKVAAEIHKVVDKGLFDYTKAMPDIQLAIGFMSTRVKDSDKDD